MLKEIIMANGTAVHTKGSSQTLPFSLALLLGISRSLFVLAEYGFGTKERG